MRDPSVAVIAPNFPPRVGGIESYTAGLATHAWPGSTTVVAPPHPGAEAWDATAPFRVIRRGLVGPAPPRWWHARSVIGEMEAQADVLVCAEWWPAARAAAGRRRSVADRAHRRPLRVLMVHGTEVIAARGRTEASMCRAVRSMDLVVANSRYTKSRLVERVRDCPPVEILHPGVDTDPPRADPAIVRHRLGLGRGPIVLTAARLVARKGHAPFAMHWPAIESQVPGVQWVVVGDGPCSEQLRRMAGPSVHVVGTVEPRTLMALFAMAEVHLLPGLASDDEVEGFGMSIVEAGAAGTPSVASDIGGTGEALGEGGVLVPGGDMEAMAKAVVELLQDGPRRELLGRRARSRAQDLRWDLIGSRFRRMVDERLVGRSR